MKKTLLIILLALLGGAATAQIDSTVIQEQYQKYFSLNSESPVSIDSLDYAPILIQTVDSIMIESGYVYVYTYWQVLDGLAFPSNRFEAKVYGDRSDKNHILLDGYSGSKDGIGSQYIEEERVVLRHGAKIKGKSFNPNKPEK